ncbi:site-specific integrase [Bradyrhizobium sp. 180]|uniref:tyrosine-type recombinase/integrase n=1 Tax=Bradyrhizobium sp. 180 TaxID=2782650 RepID=UPI001FF81309|nr:site-specific integrase [Bradyrhizobium sp. 180]MCK1493463.1 site-specific integrase [Bradyrhizobium sp. 180]
MRESSRTSKRSHGDGSIDRRGESVYRLRYRVNGKRFTKTFHGTLGDARKELRALLRAGDTGEHVDPTKLTVGEWIEQWLDAGAPGRRRKKVSQRTLERYAQLLRTHVKPALGDRQLQKLRAADIDKLYADIETKGEIAPRTAHHVHTVFGACLATAFRKGMIAGNPMLRVERVPNPEGQVFEDEELETDEIGEGLDEAELARLIAGFEPSGLYPVVVLAASTGARRNELLALRWTDLDADKKTLRIERAWEQTKKFGLRLKPPKTKRGVRTIELDDASVTMLLKEKERHQRIVAGIPDGVDVDLSLIKLPANALMFPAVPEPGEDYDFATPRNPRNFSKEFARRSDHLREQARKADVPSFGKTRFHDLRGIHSTALLDAGIPVHTVAQRIGDDPAVLLRNYAKRKRSKKANKSVAAAIAAFASEILRK